MELVLEEDGAGHPVLVLQQQVLDSGEA